jgi:hypothetical protein
MLWGLRVHTMELSQDDSLVQYIRSSESLRKISLDASLVQMRNSTCRQVVRILNAIAENHSIEDVHCEFYWPHWQELAHLLRTKCGLKRFSLNINVSRHNSLDDSQLGFVADVLAATSLLEEFALHIDAFCADGRRCGPSTFVPHSTSLSTQHPQSLWRPDSLRLGSAYRFLVEPAYLENLLF